MHWPGHGVEEASLAPGMDLVNMTGKEWRWISPWMVLIVFLVALPYFMATAFPPEGFRFTGNFWVSGDLSQYKAAMREGAASSSWLIHDHLTPVPHEPALIFPFFVALGKVASWAGLEIDTVYRTTMFLAQAF